MRRIKMLVSILLISVLLVTTNASVLAEIPLGEDIQVNTTPTAYEDTSNSDGTKEPEADASSGSASSENANVLSRSEIFNRPNALKPAEEVEKQKAIVQQKDKTYYSAKANAVTSLSQSDRLVDTAQSQVGYMETTYPNGSFYSIYGDWYENNCNAPGFKYGPWCAMFVTYCAAVAEIPTSIVPSHASCGVGINWFRSKGLWQPSGAYIPKKGDIVYFRNGAHVGIVKGTTGTALYTIEGNASDSSGKNFGVREKTYSLKSVEIYGYGTPKYEGGSSETSTLTAKLSLNKSSPQSTGTSVQLSATATGGSGNYKYKFLINDTQNNWYKIQDYSTSSTCSWMAGASGLKTLHVDVKDSNGKIARKSLSFTVSPKSNVLEAKLSLNKSSPQSIGTSVQLSAGATGGSGNYKYKFLINDTQNNWYKIQDYSTSSTCSWMAGASGLKTLHVDVKDSNGKIARKSLSFTVSPKSNVLEAKLSLNKSSPQSTGTSVQLSATATGGSGNYKYKFLINDTKNNWYKIQDYSTSSTCSWVTGAIGQKMLHVDVKDGNGKVTRKSLPFVVRPKSAELSVNLTLGKSSPQEVDTLIPLTASASGGSGNYQYKFIIDDGRNNWSLLQNYSTRTTCNWVPGATGQKTLHVDVKDGNGKVARKSLPFKVEQKFTVLQADLHFGKSSPQVVGASVPLVGSATGGTGSYKYKFIMDDGKGNLTILQDYSTKDKCTWVTRTVGKMTLHVDVQDSGGRVSRKSLPFTVKNAEVPVEVPVSGVTLSRSSVQMAVGENTSNLVTTVSPSNASNKSFTYTSSNNGVVSVDSKGHLNAVEAGEATVTVKSNNGRTAKCEIYVHRDRVTFPEGTYSIKLSGTDVCLDVLNEDTINGANVQLWGYHGGPSQIWRVRNIHDNMMTFWPECAPDKVLDVNRGGTSYNDPISIGNNVDIWENNDWQAQEWILSKLYNGTYAIRLNEKQDGALAATNNTIGNNVYYAAFNSVDAKQQWVISAAAPPPPPPPPAEDWVDGWICNTAEVGNVHCRDNPGGNSIGGFNEGQQIRVDRLRTNAGWYFVQGTNRNDGNQISGWTHGDYIRFDKPVVTEPNLYATSYNKSANPFAQANLFGQCTWYAWGRANEVNNINLPMRGNAGSWLSVAQNNGYNTGSSPRANSIAVWAQGAYGHVAYVENVVGDSVTITESNWDRTTYDNKYTIEDGIYYYSGSKTMSSGQMNSRGSFRLIGYVYL